MEEETYTVPAPVMHKGKLRMWRIEFTMRQLGEASVIAVLLFIVNALLDVLGGGILGELHLIVIFALIGAGIWYVFVPINARVGTAWLILALRWYRNSPRHLAYSRKSSAPRIVAIYRESSGRDHSRTEVQA